MTSLVCRQFGDAMLRQTARKLSDQDITSADTQKLIAAMQQMLQTSELGVGLAAPQVGESMALAVIWIEPTSLRPNAKPYSNVIINPEIVRTIGRRRQLWEGCISAGSHGTADLFAKVPRYASIEVAYTNVAGERKQELVSGLVAHIMQHEIDHLNGVLFVDRVKDTKTFMTNAEYKKMLNLT